MEGQSTLRSSLHAVNELFFQVHRFYFAAFYKCIVNNFCEIQDSDTTIARRSKYIIYIYDVVKQTMRWKTDYSDHYIKFDQDKFCWFLYLYTILLLCTQGSASVIFVVMAHRWSQSITMVKYSGYPGQIDSQEPMQQVKMNFGQRIYEAKATFFVWILTPYVFSSS